MQSRWYHKPVLHTAYANYEKKAGWLELFYDLIFVAAFIQLGNGLSENIGLKGGLVFVSLFIPLWFAWTGFSFYSNRFNVDDFLHRVLVFVQMFSVGAMAVSVPKVFEGSPEAFAVSFAIAQLVVALLYYRTYRQAEGKGFSRYWGTVFGIGSVSWFFSVFLPQPWNYTLWGLGLLLIVLAPFSRHSRALAEESPYDIEHLSERYGLLTIIVLGESFVKVLSSLSGDGNVTLIGQAVFTLSITCAVWWIYFDDVAGSKIREGRFSLVYWLFGHIPLQAAIVAMGVAVKKAVFFDLGEVAPAKYRWFLCIALASVFFSVALIDSVTERRNSEMSDQNRVNARYASALATLLLASAGGAMSAGWFLGIIVLVCGFQVLFDMMMAPFEEAAHLRATESTTDVMKRKRAGEKVNIAAPSRIGQAVIKGTPNDLRKDLYFYFIEGSWKKVFVAIAFLYFMMNVVFASLYLLKPGCIAETRANSFADAFFFSVQTMSTIGYGTMTPVSTYGHVIVTIEAAIGLIGVALVTGLMFAKASSPKASILFSRKAVVTKQDGVPTLIFRVGNARGSDIIDANISVSVLKDTITKEGHHLRRVFDLELVRKRTAFFVLSWVVMHRIDDKSPLKDVNWKKPEQKIMGIVAVLTGHDGVYGQTIYSRHIFNPGDVKLGEQFVDVLHQLPDGRMMLDYSLFHDTKSEKPA